MTIQIDNNDLTNCKVDALVNTVNCVGIMGKGIALQFKNKWPENFKSYEKACKNNQVQIGKMFVFHASSMLDKPNYIINFPTKKHWRNKSELSYIVDGLDDLVKVIKELQIKSVAIPALGCGLGGLDWNIVFPIIKEKLTPLLSDVEIHVFQPNSEYTMLNNLIEQEFPKLTIGRALLIHLITFYQELKYTITVLEMQKLAYFIKESGYQNYDKVIFTKELDGPTSTNIDNFINTMSPEYLNKELISEDEEQKEYDIVIVDKVAHKSSAMLESNEEALIVYDRVKQLIDGYTHPYGMELLSSVHWVVKHEKKTELNDIISAIYSWGDNEHPDWSKRKKILISETDIETAVNRLKEYKWIE